MTQRQLNKNKDMHKNKENIPEIKVAYILLKKYIPNSYYIYAYIS